MPAPLGPMSAWRAPCSTVRDMSLATAKAPKCFMRSLVSSAARHAQPPDGVARPANAATQRCQAPLGESHEAAPGEEDQGDKRDPDPELPVLGADAGEQVLRDDQGKASYQAAVQGARAAEHDHEQDFGRFIERKHVEGDELRRLGQEGPGDPCQGCRHGVGDHETPGHRRAERVHTPLVLLDAAQGKAVRGMDDAPDEEKREKEHDHAVHVGGAAVEVEAPDPQDGPETAMP